MIGLEEVVEGFGAGMELEEFLFLESEVEFLLNKVQFLLQAIVAFGILTVGMKFFLLS